MCVCQSQVLATEAALNTVQARVEHALAKRRPVIRNARSDPTAPPPVAKGLRFPLYAAEELDPAVAGSIVRAFQEVEVDPEHFDDCFKHEARGLLSWAADHCAPATVSAMEQWAGLDGVSTSPPPPRAQSPTTHFAHVPKDVEAAILRVQALRYSPTERAALGGLMDMQDDAAHALRLRRRAQAAPPAPDPVGFTGLTGLLPPSGDGVSRMLDNLSAVLRRAVLEVCCTHAPGLEPTPDCAVNRTPNCDMRGPCLNEH